jgi:hypothetical protein
VVKQDRHTTALEDVSRDDRRASRAQELKDSRPQAGTEAQATYPEARIRLDGVKSRLGARRP